MIEIRRTWRLLDTNPEPGYVSGRNRLSHRFAFVPDTRTHFADDDWSQLESVLEVFSRAWSESPTPPELVEYLDASSGSIRPKLAVELIKIDLEARWQRGLRRLIEDYREKLPDLDQWISGTLIFEEYHIRNQAGDSVTPAEYFRRFPDHARELEQLFRVDPVLRSSVLADESSGERVGLSPGQTIDDFDLLLRLGEGAFATVFLARQRSMQRLVAVKVSADRGSEPQTLAQLDHHNIVRVYDQRTLADRGLRLLYMQYAAGGTLAGVIVAMRSIPQEQRNGRFFLKVIDDVLDRHGEQPPAESTVRKKVASMTWGQVTAWIGTQLAQALHVAHRQGILHRDLKPANVLLTSEGIPKLADFNISFSANLAGSSPAAYFGGSLGYMSPEQLQACLAGHEQEVHRLDGRSDQFSLGILLWELLQGCRPFDDETRYCGWETRLMSMSRQRLQGPVSLPEKDEVTPDAPGLMPVLRRCLSPLASNRFGDGLELVRELELCLQPEARKLTSTTDRGWRRVARRFPLSTVTLLTVFPNLIAAVFNFNYNHGQIELRMPSAEPTFMKIQAIINLITFPAGISCAGWLAGSVARGVKLDRRGGLSATELLSRRRKCLDLGNLAAIVGLTLWLIAAPAYPIALHLMLGNVPSAVYVHFVASLALCGLIAAAYPFFAVSFVAIRCFYPRLIRWDSIAPDDVHGLQKLSRLCWLYLGLAASVPMIAVMLLVLSGSNDRFELVVLAAGGVIGFGIALFAFRLAQSDLATLIRLMSPDDL